MTVASCAGTGQAKKRCAMRTFLGEVGQSNAPIIIPFLASALQPVLVPVLVQR